MTGVRVGKGSHDISIEYTPEGFVLGVTATVVSLALIILIMICEKRRRLRRRRHMMYSAVSQNTGNEVIPSPYNNKAEIYDQVSEALRSEDFGRVEDTEVILYDGSDPAKKEADDA